MSAARLAVSELEYTARGDLFHDSVLRAYEPVAAPEGKLRSLNLLVESFALAGVEGEGRALLEQVRRDLGPFRTVWAIKHSRDADVPLAWELYFTDVERTRADLSIERIKKIVAPILPVDAEEPWPLPWHVFSVDFAPSHLRGQGAASVHVYIDIRSYELRGRNFVLENIYTFHHPQEKIDEILHRLRMAVHVNARKENLARLLPPSLLRCYQVCIANKHQADGIYFSRVSTAAFQEFIETHTWPGPLLRFVAEHRPLLGHLLWDVAFDFRTMDGGLQVPKTVVFGSF